MTGSRPYLNLLSVVEETRPEIEGVLGLMILGAATEPRASMNRIFFYGLFMDRALLTEQGLRPEVLGPARLPDYRIHIGQRATLVQRPGSRAFGVVMELTEEEARVLYSAPSVREYIPESIHAELLESGHWIEADGYNLPPEIGLAGTNPTYASQLARLTRNLGLDPAYVEEIAAFAAGS